MSGGKASSSRPDSEAAADLLLLDGGNSVDAVIGGFLAAAAVDPGTLFAPVAMLVAGVGRGARCVDGRPLQPGVGTRRPRGLAPGQPTPDAAFAAVPRSLGVLALGQTHGASKTLASLVRPAAAAARKAGAEGRANLLAAIGSRGARALQQSEIARALLLAAGPTAGGMFVEDDLDSLVPEDSRALVRDLSGGGSVVLPTFQGTAAETEDAASPRREPARPAEVLVAADVAGTVAALAWCPDPEGVLVPELDVRLPRDGAPIVRGVPRVGPRTVRAAALPLAVLARPTDGWYASLGVSSRAPLLEEELKLGADGLLPLLERLADVQRGALAVSASVSRGKVQSMRVGGRR
ncbi:MAG: hypothetical protein FJ096_16550 [Deltaproteobacteria bacterium]|nr:hypothetical protein [Deltaproteobacteria bacterium]